MRRVVIASNNPGKVAEITALLGPAGLELVAQSVLGVAETPEPYLTFVENALAKARNASRQTGLPALADDSGICVDTLDGAPGVRSARFAEDSGSTAVRDERNNQKLLECLTTAIDRHAHYYCVMVLVRTPADPQPLICEGEWHGEIMHEPRGDGGFGYDPVFLVPELGKTGAELSLTEKNRLSHRGRALAALEARLFGFDRHRRR